MTEKSQLLLLQWSHVCLQNKGSVVQAPAVFKWIIMSLSFQSYENLYVIDCDKDSKGLEGISPGSSAALTLPLLTNQLTG